MDAYESVVVCTVAGICFLVLLERAFNMLPKRAELQCAASERLADARFRSGDVILVHSFAPLCFFAGGPWSHAGMVLVDRFGHELFVDMTPKGNVRVRDLRKELLDLVPCRLKRVAVRHLERGTPDADTLFDFVREHRYAAYGHTYLTNLIARSALWFAAQPPDDEDAMFCSTFVVRALSRAGIVQKKVGAPHPFPHDLCVPGGMRCAPGYSYGPLTLLHL